VAFYDFAMNPVATSVGRPAIKHRILIVDDDELVIQSFERVFQEFGRDFSVHKTTDSSEALRLIETNSYDIIITDLVMPEVDGIQVLQRAKEVQPDVEVILITAYSSYNSAVDAMYFGAFDYISKPVNTSELKTRLTRAINKHTEIVEKNRRIFEMERLYYTIAHDFKSTILSIKSFSEMLSKEYFDKVKDQEGRFLLGRIDANVAAMEAITEGLLEYSRIGRYEEEWVDIDVNTVVREIIDNYSVQLRNRDIEVRVEGPLPKVRFYLSGVRSIFSNLIDNAVKYTRSDVNSHIRVGVEQKQPRNETHHLFYIEDNGIGIKEENIDRIFEIFHREDAEGVEHGYGIGLALVKKTLDTAGCFIEVESAENQKTVFRFTLPRSGS
jgi:signal transduction histidine kinase